MPNVPIVSRSEWGATPWQGSGVHRVAMSEKVDFLVHYHGGKPRHSTGVAVPREVEKIHLANDWTGVGYNFLVDQDGVAYEGRGWDGVGAQCPGHNRSGIGVYGAIGGDQSPSQAMLNTIRALYDEGCRRSGNALRKMGHRDGVATACPGEKLYAWVRSGMPSQGYTGNGGMTAPTPRPKPSGKLDEDGKFGPATTRRFQSLLGTEVDGEISHQTIWIRDHNPGLVARSNWKFDRTGKGSLAIREHQRRLKGKGLYAGTIDGLAGPNYWHAVQRSLGLDLPANDREISDPSATVRALQRRMNAGKL